MVCTFLCNRKNKVQWNHIIKFVQYDRRYFLYHLVDISVNSFLHSSSRIFFRKLHVWVTSLAFDCLCKILCPSSDSVHWNDYVLPCLHWETNIVPRNPMVLISRIWIRFHFVVFRVDQHIVQHLHFCCEHTFEQCCLRRITLSSSSSHIH